MTSKKNFSQAKEPEEWWRYMADLRVKEGIERQSRGRYKEVFKDVWLQGVERDQKYPKGVRDISMVYLQNGRNIRYI